MDVLSDILENLSLRSTVFAQTELAAPWGLHAEPRPELAFHIVSSGHCWFQVEDEPMVEVASGDVLLLAPERAHSLRDHPSTAPVSVRELLQAGAFGSPATSDRASRTQIICGFFRIDDAGGEVLRSVLPRVIHTRDATTDRDPWISQTLRLLALESTGTQPGRSTVVSRLCEALFVYVLRDHLAVSSAESGWMRGLLDPHVSRALELMHQAPDHDWTVASLASRVGMSRSAFAAHFQELVSETPMRYLARWRMQKAATALRSGEIAIASIATQAGYDSVAAFSKAFKRAVGVAPGAYRRRQIGSAAEDVALVADE
ncbi:MAG TPA: AraC family transcriptional regulator [Kofleriaceae bacterium]